jgi:cbb3-type cytochrome oxidase subunit 1
MPENQRSISLIANNNVMVGVIGFLISLVRYFAPPLLRDKVRPLHQFVCFGGLRPIHRFLIKYMFASKFIADRVIA